MEHASAAVVAFAAGLLDGPDHVVRETLASELHSHRGVEDDEPSAGQHRHGLLGAVGRRLDDGLDGVLALLEGQAAGGHGSVLGRRPVTRLGGLNRGLDVPAQSWAGGAGVHREPSGDAEVGLRRVGQVDQAHVLDVHLLANDC